MNIYIYISMMHIYVHKHMICININIYIYINDVHICTQTHDMYINIYLYILKFKYIYIYVYISINDVHNMYTNTWYVYNYIGVRPFLLTGAKRIEWMGMGVAGIIIHNYGSFPHSLLSTSKNTEKQYFWFA